MQEIETMSHRENLAVEQLNEVIKQHTDEMERCGRRNRQQIDTIEARHQRILERILVEKSQDEREQVHI